MILIAFQSLRMACSELIPAPQPRDLSRSTRVISKTLKIEHFKKCLEPDVHKMREEHEGLITRDTDITKFINLGDKGKSKIPK